MNKTGWLTAFTAGALTISGAIALAGAKSESKPVGASSTKVKTRVLADVDSIGPGETFHLVALFEIPKHWHTYWKNPGAGAAATKVSVTAPEGFVVGDAIYSRPRVIPSEVGDVYGYEDHAAVFVPIIAPAGLSVGEATLAAKLNWAVCKDICLMEQANVTMTLPTRDAPSRLCGLAAPELHQIMKQLPRPLKDLQGADWSYQGQTLTVQAPLGGHATARFVPLDSPGVTYGAATAAVRAGAIHVSIPVEIKPEDSLGRQMFVGGLLLLGEKPEDPCYEFSMPVASP